VTSAMHRQWLSSLTLFQLFNVLNARSEDRSAFVGLFSNRWLWAAIAGSVLLQAAVIYVPLLQQAFSTVGLDAVDWLVCTVVASSVLWLGELAKLVGPRSSAPVSSAGSAR
jgi:P-type Ca2+ transporter type 2C